MRRILAALLGLTLFLGGHAAAEEPLSDWERFIKRNWNPAQPVETRLAGVESAWQHYTERFQRCLDWTGPVGRGLG